MVEEKEQKGEGGFWKRLKAGLSRTREQIASGIGDLLLGEREISDEVLDDLETSLLTTDVGAQTVQEVMEELSQRVRRKELNNTRALYGALRTLLTHKLLPFQKPLHIDSARKPFVIFVVGVNGAGKTTTIGKLARRLSQQGHSVMLAAGDTFRAAAVEQLQEWGRRNDVPVIAQGQGADAASVVYDAVQSAMARGVDVLIADTAGRLQAKTNLMEELAKIRRVVSKLLPDAPHETLLVLDGGVGQNALSQAKEFDAAVGVTGLVVTKLDGTAKAGVLLAVTAQAKKPIYYIGVGEGVDDLDPFDAEKFVEALLPEAHG
ncbi:MAG: signal recognition particle-docking protein FtsY [Pseudomonadales bacterium]|nr:signal recognition particle-docking protein FtsY [Pseudomonadales bacterium]MCP5183433.1 signal recognition particle-docking protein FtsY [Pseudomonadales bacterium]